MGLNHLYGCGVALTLRRRWCPFGPFTTFRLTQLWRRGDGDWPGLREITARTLLVGTDDVQGIPLENASIVSCRMKSMSVFSPWSRIFCRSRTPFAQTESTAARNLSSFRTVVGMQCGGSDAFSGVTANPALGMRLIYWCAAAQR